MTEQIEAGVLRRLAAMFYDGLLTLAIWLIASALPLLFNRGEAVESGNPLMSLYLLAITFVFFGWFWTHGGQTVGMRAWRLRLEQRDGNPLNWKVAFWRFLSALPAWALFVFGVLHATVPVPLPLPALVTDAPAGAWLVAALIWLIVDNRPRSWRDRLTGTRVVVLGKDQQAAHSANAL